MSSNARIRSIEIVLPCEDLAATSEFFVDRLGFRIESVLPADDPRAIVLSGHGTQIRLQRGAAGSPGVLRLVCDDPNAGWPEVAPNGTRIEVAAASPRVEVPPSRPRLSIQRIGDGASWTEGRAGMRYRDLLPDRAGGRYIASHIRIEGGGPVPDYVHFHRVRLQTIFCHRGWVKVVYEGQGDPFVMEAGDCVLQPPTIRHRVLESSPGLEVIELTCPAEHETFADHDRVLPDDRSPPERRWDGQAFVRHRGAEAPWSERDGVRVQRLGLAEATDGALVGRRLRPLDPRATVHRRHDDDLRLSVVRTGRVTLTVDGRSPVELEPDDAFVVPAGVDVALSGASRDLEWLELSSRLP